MTEWQPPTQSGGTRDNSCRAFCNLVVVPTLPGNTPRRTRSAAFRVGRCFQPDPAVREISVLGNAARGGAALIVAKIPAEVMTIPIAPREVRWRAKTIMYAGTGWKRRPTRGQQTATWWWYGAECDFW